MISLQGQNDDTISGFKEYYPIAVQPYLAGGFGNNPYEEILFDAKPVVYYSIYNDIRRQLNKEEMVPGDAIYISFQPQIRMYSENSKPVKTPSYKIFLGWQPIIKTTNNNFFTFAFESGHYSNGQAKSAFSTEFDDGSPESIALYETITDATDLTTILNRTSGNFSTNLTRLSLNFRDNGFDEEFKPKHTHSYTFSYQLYHNNFFGLFNFGGYNPEDIDLYGRHRLEFNYQFTKFIKKSRFTLGQEVKLHFGSHPSTDPYRLITNAVFYPRSRDLGLFLQFSTGFDDYNFRFVDSYSRLSFGVTWDWFTPFVIKPSAPKN